MKGYHANIEDLTLSNSNFRQVLYTGEHMQLVLMALPPGGEIGRETHHENDQFFRFESGVGRVVIDDNEYTVKHDDAIIVPAGAAHNVINDSDDEPLKLYTIYGPSHHQDGVVRETREDAEASSPHFDGKTTE